MEGKKIHGAWLAIMFAVSLAAVGCSKSAVQGGPYAPAKKSWDSAHSTQLEDSLRNRLVHTQQDH